MKLDLTKITAWNKCSKTKSIKAKPLRSLLIDENVFNKFLVNTLEGREPLALASIICLGEGGDIWQQTAKKLLSKYEVVDIDTDAWLICKPKDGNISECVEITDSVVRPNLDPAIHDNRQDDGNYYILAQWGEETSEGNIQRCKAGDYILRDPNNISDVWIVARSFFLNTYSVVE